MKRDEASSADSTGGTEASKPPEVVSAPHNAPPHDRAFGLRRAVGHAAAAVSHPKMRADLRFVHEGPGPEDAQRLPGLLRVIDLRSDRKFDFTAQEHFLCREADGVATPEELQHRLNALTETPLSAVEVAKFFRRLNILGLLESEEKTPAAETPRLRARTPRAALPPTKGKAAPDPTPEPPASKLMLVRPEPEAAPAAASEADHSTPTPGTTAPPEPQAAPAVAAARRFTPHKPEAKTTPLEDDFGFDELFGPGAGGGGGDADGRFGGRMRPGMGGMGPGMGGMGGMGGGMMGMRGRQMPETQEKELGPTQFPLFNPDLLFRVLFFTFWPLKFFLWTLLPFTVFSGLIVIQKMPEVTADLAALIGSADLVAKLLAGLLIANLGSRIAQGVAITAQGGRVKSLGINLLLGFSPRFYIDESAVEQLDRRGQIWAYGAPLMYRLSLFVFGILFWAIMRAQGGSVPLLALTVAQFGLLMFLITACPLIPTDGMRFMGAVLGEPKILRKSLMAANGLFLEGRLPPMITREEAWPLALFAVGTILFCLFMIGAMAVVILIALKGTLGGLGVSIFLVLMAVATLWFMAMFRQNSRKMKAKGFAGMGAMGGPAAAEGHGLGGARTLRAPDQPQLKGERAAARPGLAASLPGSRTAPTSDVVRMPNRARVVWSLILCALLVAAFLPYRYESGGPVEILPAARATAVARTDGEIVEVLVAQGDRVTAGMPLVRLSDWDQLSDISVREAQLAGAVATLAKLEAGSQIEEIDVARAKLARSEAALLYKQAELERARTLVASQTASPAALEKAESEQATAKADVEADKANLALTMAGATPEELEIARAEVDRLQRELAYDRDELLRTRILAPMDGVVVTANMHLRVGGYLKTGEAFLEIEQTGTVTATISIPEADIAFIAPGQAVRLRSASQSGIEVIGKVQQVAPVAEDAGYGRIIRATAVFPNEDGILRSSMTGWAKIEGAEMLAWEAYLRTIVRFFKIEVWSWIP